MHVLYCTCCKLATLEMFVGGVTGGIVLAIVIGFVYIHSNCDVTGKYEEERWSSYNKRWVTKEKVTRRNKLNWMVAWQDTNRLVLL